MLPAFVSYYVGAREERLPAASTRAVQGLAAGLLVAAGFLALFALVGLPVIYGAGAVTDAVPWAGIVVGVALAVVGVAALLGRDVHLPVRSPVRSNGRGARTMLMFGVAYAVASLGCTLPIFLALVGASLGAHALTVFAAYAGGATVVLTAVAVAAALLRDGLIRAVRPLLPYVGRLAGALLAVAGGYLTYYYVRVRFGPAATLADDPLVGRVLRFTAQVQSSARGRGAAVVYAAAVVVAAAALAAMWQRRRQKT